MIISDTGATRHSTTTCSLSLACYCFVLFGVQMQQKVVMGRKVYLSPEPFIGGGYLRIYLVLNYHSFKTLLQLPPPQPCSSIIHIHTSTVALRGPGSPLGSGGEPMGDTAFGLSGAWCLYTWTLILSESLLTEQESWLPGSQLGVGQFKNLVKTEL